MSKGGRQGDPGEGGESIGDHPDALLKELRTAGGLTVWLVDGELIRNLIYIDFTEGGNPQAYPWMPKDQVWIDNANAPEADFILLHELHEYNRMRLDGLTYDQGHSSANKIEMKARRDPELTERLLQAETDLIEQD